MKYNSKIYKSVTFLIGIIFFVFMFVSQTMAQTGLISWWPGEGNAKDIVDSNHGTLQGGAQFAAGKIGRAFFLDGIDDFVDLGNAPNLQVSKGDFTVNAWVWFNALSGVDMSIVDKMSASGVNTDGWRLLKQSDNRFWFCFGGDTENRCYDSAFTIFSSTQAMTNVWYHVAAVKSSSRFSIYINGVLEDTRSPVPNFLDTNSANLRIGSYSLEGSYLNGKVDEVKIYNRALTDAEIQAIYLAGTVGGSITGVSPRKVICTNLTTRQRVIIHDRAISWSCEAAGLVVNPGDIIRQTVIGRAN